MTDESESESDNESIQNIEQSIHWLGWALVALSTAAIGALPVLGLMPLLVSGMISTKAM